MTADPDTPRALPIRGLRWRHVKSGGIYRVIATGLIEATLTPCVIYMTDLPNGAVWVRPHDEFLDGRFVCIDREAPATFQQAFAGAKLARKEADRWLSDLAAAREALRLAARAILAWVNADEDICDLEVDALRAIVAILPDALDGAPEWVRKAVERGQ